MTFCSNCGSEARVGGQFCPSCGKPSTSCTVRPGHVTTTQEPETGVFEPPVHNPIQQPPSTPSLAIPIIFGWPGAWWASNRAAKLGIADTGKYWKAAIISSLSLAAVSLLVPFTIISLLGIALHSADTSVVKPSNSRISPAGPSPKGIDRGSATAAPGVAAPSAKGIDPGSATAAPGAPAAVPIDQAKVAALTEKVTANPKDVASLQGLGDAYFAASDYRNAALWEQKVLTVDPKNEVALLAAGAAQFNLGNAAQAKKQWLVAAALYPDNAEVHYDLGFLYLSQTPPDKARMTAEWKKVVAIDPNSSLAKTVATHLNDR